MAVSQNRGPQNTIVLVMGTPKKGTPNFRKPLDRLCRGSADGIVDGGHLAPRGPKPVNPKP